MGGSFAHFGGWWIMAMTDTGLTDSSRMNRGKMAAASKSGLAVRGSATLDTVQDALVALTARYRADEVLTAVKHFPAREAVFRAMPSGRTAPRKSSSFIRIRLRRRRWRGRARISWW
jgi:hypothetical protein